MPKIRSSADLRNNYNDISTFCHTYAEPVFITKNGKGDLAVMSIETYEEMVGRFELYGKLQEGLDDVAAGRTRPWAEVKAELAKRWECSTKSTFPTGHIRILKMLLVLLRISLKILLPHRILFAEHSAPLTRWKNSRLGFPLYETLS